MEMSLLSRRICSLLWNICEWRAGEVGNRWQFVFTAGTTGINTLGRGSCLSACLYEKIYLPKVFTFKLSPAIFFHYKSLRLFLFSRFKHDSHTLWMGTLGFTAIISTRCLAWPKPLSVLMWESEKTTFITQPVETYNTFISIRVLQD